MFGYKLKDRGNKLVKVGRFYPSTQVCPSCGYILTDDEKLDLNKREWACPEHGAHHDRDHNAAINIRFEGMNILLKEGYIIA